MNTQSKLPSVIYVLVLTLTIIVTIVAISSVYIYSIDSQTRFDMQQHLKNISLITAKNLTDKLDSDTDKLNAISVALGINNSLPTTYSLRNFGNSNTFSKIVFYKSENIDSAISDFGNLQCFENALNGISDTFFLDQADKNGNITLTVVPYYQDDKIAGVLAATNTTQKIISSANLSENDIFITKKDGSVILNTTNTTGILPVSNIFSFQYNSESEYNKLKSDISSDASGITSFIQNKQSLLAGYSSIDNYDLVLFEIVEETSVNANAALIFLTTIVFAGSAFLTLLILLLYIIISQNRAQRELNEIAFTDPLTNGLSKNKFDMEAASLINKKDSYAYIHLDVDKLKVFNDLFGHQMGTELIKHIYQTINSNLSEHELCCRTVDDHFNILLKYTGDKELRYRLMLLVYEISSKYSVVKEIYYEVVISIGVYVLKPEDADIFSIYNRVRYAHNQAKMLSDSKISYYDDDLATRLLKEKDIESKMYSALNNGEFYMYLQPKYKIPSEQLYGAEALVRWFEPDGSIFYPNDFIPVFEKNGFIVKLDMFMFEEACKCVKSWLNNFSEAIPISVNFSRLHLYDPNFAEDLYAITQKYDVPAKYFEVEITETVIMDNTEQFSLVLNKLHAFGFTISMDDFGSGFSSLEVLKNVPVDTIKLDASFFTKYTNLSRAKSVIANVIVLAKALEMHTVAEGVETQEHVELLHELKCDAIQGFYYSRPIPAPEMLSLFQNC